MYIVHYNKILTNVLPKFYIEVFSQMQKGKMHT